MPFPLNLLRLLVVSLLLAFVLPTAASGISKDDLDAQKELLQLKIDSGKEILQKDIEAQGKRLDALDKRIDDQVSRVSDIGNAVDRFTAISGWIGILITVLLASGGLVGYFSVVAKARREAKETASNWFAENEIELRAKIDSLHVNACNTINDTIQGVHNSAAEAKAVIDRAQKEFGSTQPDTSPSPDNDNDAQALLRRTDELKAIPENSYSFDDWNTRAFAAYKAGQLEEAALYWGNAAKVPTAGAENSAQATFNRAVMLGQMEKNEEVIALYDQLIATYADDKTPALREQVAKAMLNKAVTLGQMEKNEEVIALYDQLIATYADDRTPALREQVAKAMSNKAVRLGKKEKNEEAIALYDQLIATYADDKTPALREQVAKAMLNKAVTLGQMEKNEEEIALYDQLIATYADDKTPALREQVANALNGNGFTRLLVAKKNWANGNLAQDSLIQAEANLQACLARKPQWGMALGNLAYVQWLLGKPQAAEHSFCSALAAGEDGGETLYKATLDDIAQHPIPEDTGFRELVDRIWAEYQASLPTST